MPILAQSDWYVFGCSRLEDGGFVTSDESPEQSERYQNVIRGLNVTATNLAVCQLCHGSKIEIVMDSNTTYLPETDGAVTSKAGIALIVTGADCPPVFLVDPAARAIALVHSGRRGTAANIVGKAVDRMCSSYGARPEDLEAVIGPGICQQHYEVTDEIAEAFRKRYAHRIVNTVRAGHALLDVPGILVDQLREAGLTAQRIAPSLACTYEHPEQWASFRRDTHEGKTPKDLQPQMYVAMITKS